MGHISRTRLDEDEQPDRGAAANPSIALWLQANARIGRVAELLSLAARYAMSKKASNWFTDAFVAISILLLVLIWLRMR